MSARRHVGLAALVVALVCLAGCDRRQRECEKGRALFLERTQALTEEALANATEQESAELRQRAQKETAHASSRFVAVCNELGEFDATCLEKDDSSADEKCKRIIVELTEKLWQ